MYNNGGKNNIVPQEAKLYAIVVTS